MGKIAQLLKEARSELNARSRPAPAASTPVPKAPAKGRGGPRKQWLTDKDSGKRMYADWKGQLHTGAAAFRASMAATPKKAAVKTPSKGDAASPAGSLLSH